MFFRISVMALQTRPETELANRKLLSVTTASASAGTTEYQTLSATQVGFSCGKATSRTARKRRS